MFWELPSAQECLAPLCNLPKLGLDRQRPHPTSTWARLSPLAVGLKPRLAM